MTADTSDVAAERDLVDVAVVGGGPAGIAAALWAARYRRRVLLFDAGRQRNRWTDVTHGYLGLEDISPRRLIEEARADLHRYPGVGIVHGTVTHVTSGTDQLHLHLDDGRVARSLRLVLATGVTDVLPDIGGFDEHFGTSVFTCPTCDGYEAQGKNVVVIGEDDRIAQFALGLLDWASRITVVVAPVSNVDRESNLAALQARGVGVITGEPARLVGAEGQLQRLEFTDGHVLDCDMMFCTVNHVQHSNLGTRLGCELTDEGSVLVDDHGRTTVPHVFAAGDMTPGPHLVQVAAAEGAVAGIAAAESLRGTPGAPLSPLPAPDSSQVLPD